MPDYNLGKIYSIVCNTTGLIYYGSTSEKSLARRMVKHRCDFKRFVDGNSSSSLTAFQVMQNDNYVILLVEDFPCNNKQELERREYFYILNNDCVNKMYPTRTNQEYRIQNKDMILSRNANYRENNREKLRDNNKVLAECDICGITYTKVNKSQHLKSKRHISEI
jgi:site-specific DNA-adenine methylase